MAVESGEGAARGRGGAGSPSEAGPHCVARDWRATVVVRVAPFDGGRISVGYRTGTRWAGKRLLDPLELAAPSPGHDRGAIEGDRSIRVVAHVVHPRGRIRTIDQDLGEEALVVCHWRRHPQMGPVRDQSLGSEVAGIGVELRHMARVCCINLRDRRVGCDTRLLVSGPTIGNPHMGAIGVNGDGPDTHGDVFDERAHATRVGGDFRHFALAARHPDMAGIGRDRLAVVADIDRRQQRRASGSVWIELAHGCDVAAELLVPGPRPKRPEMGPVEGQAHRLIHRQRRHYGWATGRIEVDLGHRVRCCRRIPVDVARHPEVATFDEQATRVARKVDRRQHRWSIGSVRIELGHRLLVVVRRPPVTAVDSKPNHEMVRGKRGDRRRSGEQIGHGRSWRNCHNR